MEPMQTRSANAFKIAMEADEVVVEFGQVVAPSSAAAAANYRETVRKIESSGAEVVFNTTVPGIVDLCSCSRFVRRRRQAKPC